MCSEVVLFSGAGATEACGGLLTKEVLPDVFSTRDALEREGFLELLACFLRDSFHVPLDRPGGALANEYPSLPLLLSIVDMAVDRKWPMGVDWPVDRLAHVRAALEYATFALLENKLGDLTARGEKQASVRQTCRCSKCHTKDRVHPTYRNRSFRLVDPLQDAISVSTRCKGRTPGRFDCRDLHKALPGKAGLTL